MAGVDEVGVGALAGPVVAAAVVLGGGEPWLVMLDDSKRLSRAVREEVRDLIVAEAPVFGVGFADSELVDEVGIAAARRRAVVAAFAECRRAVAAGFALAAVVDDRRLAYCRKELGGAASIFADHADQRSLSVAAASIVAKTWRDAYMRLAADKWPVYDFENNVGYGTPRHLAALAEHGPCELHRRSFRPLSGAAGR